MCVCFAHLFPLYAQRGYAVEVECTPDKRLRFEATGAATVASGAGHVHRWRYPPGGTHAGHGRFFQWSYR